MIKNCLICKAEFKTIPSQIKIGKGKFCSRECYWESEKETKKWNKSALGLVHTKETKEKIRQVHLGKRLTEEHKRKIGNSNIGKKRSEEVKRKISIKLKGRKNPEHSRRMKTKMIGNKYALGMKHTSETKKKLSLASRLENNPRWLGGKSFEPYNIKWNEKLKEKIRKRDDNICQLCGYHQREFTRKLSVHHIDYNKLNCLEENLISLCLTCHARTNSKRIYWKKFFQQKKDFFEMNK